MSIDAFTLARADLAGNTVGQLQSQSYNANEQISAESGDGKVDNEFATIFSKSPAVDLTTTALNKALGHVGIGGLPLATGSVGTFYYQKLKQGGTRDSSGHVSVEFTAGMVVPRRIRATAGGVATYDLTALASAEDNNNAPIAISSGATLPSEDTTDELFTCGVATIDEGGGSPITFNPSEIEVEFGIQELQIQTGGTIYPRLAAIMRRTPQITVRGPKIDLLTGTEFQEGRAISAFPTSVVFPKAAQGGGLAGSGDKKVTVNQGMITSRTLSGETDSESQIELLITPTYDGTNDVLSIN